MYVCDSSVFWQNFLAELITSPAHLLGLPVPYAANEHCIAGGHPRLAQHVHVHRVALHMLKGALPPNQGALQPPLWLWPVLQQEKAALQGEWTRLLLWVPCTGAPASRQPHGQSSSRQKQPVGPDAHLWLLFTDHPHSCPPWREHVQAVEQVCNVVMPPGHHNILWTLPDGLGPLSNACHRCRLQLVCLKGCGWARRGLLDRPEEACGCISR